MSSKKDAVDPPPSLPDAPQDLPPKKRATSVAPRLADFKGFAAGVCSGIAKMSVGHPFDTIKVRMQTTKSSQFRGPLHCLVETVRKEGVLALYKGGTPPLFGWMAMDSLMLGSLTVYRRLLNENVFNRDKMPVAAGEQPPKLPTLGHSIAGMWAGWTVSLIAAPIEHVKNRLQIQYAREKANRLYSGPIDCASKILKNYGIAGLYRGLFATMHFRSYFFIWWGAYDIFCMALQKHTSMSTASINFWAGGTSSTVFWCFSFPSDIVKQRIMCDGLGKDRKLRNWMDAARTIYRESGWRGFFRGFMPCILRAFPANASALLAFETAMRALNQT